MRTRLPSLETLAVASLFLFAVMFFWQTNALATCRAGDEAQVLWKGQWYPAHVTSAKGNQCCIHYDGYNNSWDECVGPNRIKLAGKVNSNADAVAFNEGDKVQVKWKGTWYPASVLAVKPGKFKIHYDGYGSNWDEWVGKDRIKK